MLNFCFPNPLSQVAPRARAIAFPNRPVNFAGNLAPQ